MRSVIETIPSVAELVPAADEVVHEDDWTVRITR